MTVRVWMTKVGIAGSHRVSQRAFEDYYSLRGWVLDADQIEDEAQVYPFELQGEPDDGDTPVYDAGAGRFVPGPPAGVGTFAPLPGAAKNPLTGKYHLAGYGAVAGSTLPAAQATSDALDAILAAIGPTGSGEIWVEPTQAGYYLVRSHPVVRSGVHLAGFGGFPSGLPSSKFYAHAQGTFTNGVVTDGAMFKPAVGRTNGNPPNEWHHNWWIRGISIFGNDVAPHAILTWRNGENSGLDDVLVNGCTSDGIVCEGSQATLRWGSVDSVENGGSGFHFRNWGQGSGVIMSLSGDHNADAHVRITNGSAQADPASLTIVNIKSENPFEAGTHDPAIWLDNCNMFSLNILGGTFIGLGGTDLVRIDTPQGTGPAVLLLGIEAANIGNTGYTNIIRDTSSNKVLPAAARGYYPVVTWNRPTEVFGPLTVDSAVPVDLSSVTGNAVAVSANTFGDKISLGGRSFGFGLQSQRMIAYVPSTGAFAIRQQATSGNASAGGAIDRHTFFPDGIYAARGAVRPGNGAGASTTGLLAGAGAPTIAGTAGDFYFRNDTPTVANQRIYVCTVTGAASAATWVGIA